MKQPNIYHYSVQIDPSQLFILVLPPSWDANVALGQDKQRKLPCKIMYAFVGLASVRILRPSMAVLYHVSGKLQRAYISLLLIACHLPHYPK